jgi:hypothetical protein
MRSLKPSPKKIMLNGHFPYERVVPQRPIVARVGNKVIKCHLYDNTKECLGTRCFWPRAGVCPVFTRLDKKMKKENANGKKGKYIKKNYISNKKGYAGCGWVKNGKIKRI